MIPNNLDENMFIYIYRKQYAIIRHEIFKLLLSIKAMKNNTQRDINMKEGFEKIMKLKTVF